MLTQQVQPDCTDLPTAVYGRVSTKDQRDNSESLEVQQQHCLEFSQGYKLAVYKEYLFEEDHSGYDVDRPELNKLRRLIRAGEVKVVVVNESSRLSREIRHGEEILDEMWEHGVRLFIFYPHRREMNLHPDSPDREFLLQEMIFNRKWGKMIKQQMIWGKEGKHKRGKIIGHGGAAYGYMQVGSRENISIAINPETQEPARNLLNWYADGVSIIEICRRLRGVPTPGELKGYSRRLAKGTWTHGLIIPIVQRWELYLGIFKQTFGGDEMRLDIPPLIDKDTARRIKERLEYAKEHHSPRNRKYDYLWRNGLLRCACGAAVSGQTLNQPSGTISRYYRCNRKTSNKNTPRADGWCSTQYVQLEVVEEITIQFLKQLVNDPHIVIKAFEKQQHISTAYNEDVHRRVEQIGRTLQKNQELLDVKETLREEATAKLLTAQRFGNAAQIKIQTHNKNKYEQESEELILLVTELDNERTQLVASLAAIELNDGARKRIFNHAALLKASIDTLTNDEWYNAMLEFRIRGSIAIEDGKYWLALHIQLHDEVPPETDMYPLMDAQEGLGRRELRELRIANEPVDSISTVDSPNVTGTDHSENFRTLLARDRPRYR